MSDVTATEFLERISDLAPAIEGLRLGEYSDLIDEQATSTSTS